MLKMVLADKQAIFRAGIAKVLGVEDEIRIVAQVQSSDQIPMALEKFRPNLLAIAANLVTNLSELVTSANHTKTRLVLLAENGENGHAFVKAGVHGVVYRNVTGPALLECVHKVASGETWIQQQTLAPEEAENDAVGARVRDRLTPKELRIVALIVQGFKNKDIATELGTTEQVIKNYLRNIYDKIGVSDRLELALFTIHHRILAEAAAATGR
jgi:DNA-binding NarL/FixJ family response regulator